MSYYNYRSVFVFLLLYFFVLSSITAQEETPKLPEYSYTEFFRMIEEETDTIFELEGAAIRYDQETDSLFTAIWEKGNFIGLNRDSTIIVDKQLYLWNVHFETKYLENRPEKETAFGGALNNIIFKKWVFTQSNDFIADNCVFENGLTLYSTCDKFRNDNGIRITNCTIKKSLRIDFDNDQTCDDFSDANWFRIEDNRFVTDSLPFRFSIRPGNSNSFYVERNSGDNVNFFADIVNYQGVYIEENTFLKGQSYIGFSSPSNGYISLLKNNLGEIVFFYSDVLPLNSNIEWNQLKGKTISKGITTDIKNKWQEEYIERPFFPHFSDSLNIEILEFYHDSLSIASESNFNAEMALKGAFYNLYKSKFNRKSANEVYFEMKSLETNRFKHLYKVDKSFSSYFEWKINQFLEIFSDYGTKPAKAVVIAAQAILLFAFFYLFFPNSWDEKNKHRIMNRMLFFAKYFKRKEGLKEVFEEEHKTQIMTYEDFKSFITDSKNEIPPYFVTLSKPIYFFSVANFRVRSKILSRADILKGKWADLKPRRKAVTSITMAVWLIGILLYDLFVKFFNALMLSINTFSTLGFGEIPIKGIPRYLAIIEGFIGWFMLTIFSVSLISQLLN